MAELWDEEVTEVRLANGKVVAIHRIKFATQGEVTMICRWCGLGVVATPSTANPWKHVASGLILCRDENGKPAVPVNAAAPTVWAEGEVT